VSAQLRRALVEPLRFLLAGPYVLFLVHPAIAPAAVLGFVASIGYAASLPLQERLVDNTNANIRGQVLGLNSTGLTAMQGVAAVLAGFLAEHVHGGPATAIGVLGCASLVISLALIPGLRRSRPGPPSVLPDDDLALADGFLEASEVAVEELDGHGDAVGVVARVADGEATAQGAEVGLEPDEFPSAPVALD